MRERLGEAFWEIFTAYTAPQLIIDPADGAIVSANPAAEHFYGFSQDEFARLNIRDINQLPGEKVGENLQLAAKGQRDAFVFPHRLKNGDIRMMEVRCGTFTLQGRTLIHSFLHDASGRLAAEEELKERERQLRNIASNLPGALVQLTPTSLGAWMPTYLSAGAATLFDLPLEALLLSPFPPKTNLSPHYREKIRTALAQAASATSPVDAVFAVKKWGGGKRWVRLAATPRQEDTGLVWDGVMMDITPQVRAQRRLKQRIEGENLLVAMSQRLLNTPLAALDNAMQDVLGLLGQYFEGDRVWLFQHTPDPLTGLEGEYRGTHEWLREGIKPVLHQLDPFTTQDFPWWFDAMDRDGGVVVHSPADVPDHALAEKGLYQQIHLKSTLSQAIVWQGKRRGFIEILRVKTEKPWPRRKVALLGLACDVLAGALWRAEQDTARRHTEQALWQSQKLESLGVLAGGAAHDFNNLLHLIMSHAELAQIKLPPDHGARDNLAKLILAAERAASLCQNLLSYAGRTPVAPVSVSLPTVVEENQALLTASLPTRHRLCLPSPALLPPVLADPSLLFQILTNLLTNACEAMGETPGDIHLDWGVSPPPGPNAPGFHLGPVSPPALMVFFSVRDKGPGLESAQLPRVFDPFFSTKRSGRGLGLAGVAGIVQSLGGVIAVDNAPGGGAVFTVYLPLASDDCSLCYPELEKNEGATGETGCQNVPRPAAG